MSSLNMLKGHCGLSDAMWHTKPKLVALGDNTMPADALAPDVATASIGMVLGV